MAGAAARTSVEPQVALIEKMILFPDATRQRKAKGEGQLPVYEFPTAKHGEPQWYFHPCVVGKDGQVRAAFASAVTPDSPELKNAIATALRHEVN